MVFSYSAATVSSASIWSSCGTEIYARSACSKAASRCKENGNRRKDGIVINLELPESLEGVSAMMRAVAAQVLRPISRKYDTQEHDEPVELRSLDRRTPGAGSSRATVMEQSSQWGG